MAAVDIRNPSAMQRILSDELFSKIGFSLIAPMVD